MATGNVFASQAGNKNGPQGMWRFAIRWIIQTKTHTTKTMNKNIIGVIFDFEFNEFVTTRIIKLLFVLSIIAAFIFALVILARGIASRDAGGILGALVIAPITFIISVVMSRIWLELVIVAFRIAENTSRLVEQGKDRPGQNGDHQS